MKAMGAGWWFALGALSGFFAFPLAVAMSLWWVTGDADYSAPAADDDTAWARSAALDEGPLVDLGDPRWQGCVVPPEGWWCSREPQHTGPCAARPITLPTWRTIGERGCDRKTL